MAFAAHLMVPHTLQLFPIPLIFQEEPKQAGRKYDSISRSSVGKLSWHLHATRRREGERPRRLQPHRHGLQDVRQRSELPPAVQSGCRLWSPLQRWSKVLVRLRRGRLQLKPSVAFCDGSAIGNGQRHCAGGYACVFPHDDDLGEVGQVDWATNNRAEYTAALVALERANERDPDQNEAMYIFSDSKVLIDSMINWIFRWERNGWMTIRGTEVKNRDILEQLRDTQGYRPVYWNHVRAHTNNRDWKSFWNEIADRDAREMARDNYYNN